MVVQPTIEDAEGYSKEEIAPMLRDTQVLAERVYEAKSRDSNNTILQKNFPGGTLSMVGANSPRGFRRVSRRVVIFDETDGYPSSAGEEGDQIKLGTKRAEYFWNRKIVAGSTPTVKDFSRIEKLFLAGDQRRYFVPCPHCGHTQYLKFGGRDIPYGLKWPEGQPEKAYYVCEHNGCIIEHKEKRWMIEEADRRQRAGEPGIGWVPTAVGEPGHASFHVWAAYSYSPNATWGHLASEFVACCKDPEQLRTFVNTTLGETWEEEYSAKADPNSLLSRIENYSEDCAPAGVLVVVAGIDVQPDRLEATLYGFGKGEESWRLTHQKIYGDPEKEEVWAELDKLLAKKIDHEQAAEPLTVMAACVDSGDGNNVNAVYNYTRARTALWRRNLFPCQVVATKGSSIAGKPPIGKGTKVDFKWHSSTYKGGATVHIVGVDGIKSVIYSRLRIAEPGPGYMHFPLSADEEYFKQLTIEKRVIHYKHGNPIGRWEKKQGERNEALDCTVYAYAALHLLYTRFNRNTFWKTMANRIGLREIEENKEKQDETASETKPELPKPAPKTRMPMRKGWVTRW